jgi:hypothetical protein
LSDSDRATCSHDEVRKRLDLHNISIDFATATVGRCGFTHLASGRICQLPYRHRGACMLRPPQQPHRSAVVLPAGHEPATRTQPPSSRGHAAKARLATP